jgi:hypothetical protein
MVKWLRSGYAKAGPSLKPKSENSKMAIARDFLQWLSLNPEEILSKEAQTMPNRIILTDNSFLQSRVKLI